MSNIQLTIEEKPETYLVGIAQYGSPGELRIGEIWTHFYEMEGQIPNRINPDESYGVMIYPPKFPSTYEFTYFASVRVKDLSVIPFRMLAKKLPASLYAVFKVEGGLSQIGDIYRFAYQEWLPASDFEVAYPYDFEWYKHQPEKPHCPSETFISIPVKEKEGSGHD